MALVTQGYTDEGGVPAIVRWLRAELTKRCHEVDIYDLAASSRDVRSRRALSPATWRYRLAPVSDTTDPALLHCGAKWVELESQRYRPRQALTAALNTYDVIQVVAGGPALALSVGQARPPKVLQVATTLLAERRAHLPGMPLPKRVAKSLSLRSLNRLEVQALRAVDEVLVENRWMEKWVRLQGQSHVAVAPPGIDTDLFRPVGEWNPTRPIIAFGRLGDSRKDWPTAVEAYERFIEMTGLDNGLIVAGRGPLAAALVRRLEVSLLRDRIAVREDVSRAELPGLLASGSVFLQSSLEEGLGLAGLEAMACGLPVVATRTVGSSEYVRDGKNGYLAEVGPNAAGELAKALEATLSGGRGSLLSEQAISTCADSYSSEVAVQKFIDILEGLGRR